MCLIADANLIECIIDPAVARVLAVIVKPREHCEIPASGQVRVEAGGFHKASDSFRQRTADSIEGRAEQTNRSCVTLHESEQDAKQRRLSSPVRSKQTMHAAGT